MSIRTRYNGPRDADGNPLVNDGAPFRDARGVWRDRFGNPIPAPVMEATPAPAAVVEATPAPRRRKRKGD